MQKSLVIAISLSTVLVAIGGGIGIYYAVRDPESQISSDTSLEPTTITSPTSPEPARNPTGLAFSVKGDDIYYYDMNEDGTLDPTYKTWKTPYKVSPTGYPGITFNYERNCLEIVGDMVASNTNHWQLFEWSEFREISSFLTFDGRQHFSILYVHTIGSLVLGGAQGAGYTDSVAIITPPDSWELASDYQLQPIAEPLGYMAATAHGGVVYLAGGAGDRRPDFSVYRDYLQMADFSLVESLTDAKSVRWETIYSLQINSDAGILQFYQNSLYYNGCVSTETEVYSIGRNSSTVYEAGFKSSMSGSYVTNGVLVIFGGLRSSTEEFVQYESCAIASEYKLTSLAATVFPQNENVVGKYMSSVAIY